MTFLFIFFSMEVCVCELVKGGPRACLAVTEMRKTAVLLCSAASRIKACDPQSEFIVLYGHRSVQD